MSTTPRGLEGFNHLINSLLTFCQHRKKLPTKQGHHSDEVLIIDILPFKTWEDIVSGNHHSSKLRYTGRLKRLGLRDGNFPSTEDIAVERIQFFIKDDYIVTQNVEQTLPTSSQVVKEQTVREGKSRKTRPKPHRLTFVPSPPRISVLPNTAGQPYE
jgi:hypothetical protein